MSDTTLRAVAIFFAGLSVALLGNVGIYVMLVKVNRRLPSDKQISYIAYGLVQIQREYRRFYPGNWLYLLPWLCGFFCVICMVLLAVALRLFT